MYTRDCELLGVTFTCFSRLPSFTHLFPYHQFDKKKLLVYKYTAAISKKHQVTLNSREVMKWLIAVTLITYVSAQSAPDPNYCYAFDAVRPQQPRWSDRTSNVFIRGHAVNPSVSNCTPAKFWLYMRHGDRLPSTNDINRMIPFSSTVR